MNSTKFRDFITNSWKINQLPSPEQLNELLKGALYTLENESLEYRPANDNGKPGSFLSFSTEITTIIVPDLHARCDFLIDVLNYQVQQGVTVLDMLEKSTIRLICLGDGLHSESRGKQRWLSAYQHYKEGNIINEYMSDEMGEGLSLMTLVMKLKMAFPENFHFLRGNHENILNEDENGNHSFGKYVLEGEMTYDFMVEKYGLEITQLYSEFEYSLPLFFRDNRFLVSHAEPLSFFSKKELINASLDSKTTESLIWTSNGFASEKVVKKMIVKYCKKFKNSWYFAGHRPVVGYCKMNEMNHFIQFHNPELKIIVVIQNDESFNYSKGFVIL